VEQKWHMVWLVWKETCGHAQYSILHLIPQGIGFDFCVDVLDQ